MGEFLKTPFTQQEIPCYSKFPRRAVFETFVSTIFYFASDPSSLGFRERQLNIYLYRKNDKNINTYKHHTVTLFGC